MKKSPRLFRSLFTELGRLRDFVARLGNAPSANRRPRRLSLEGLEDRTVPAAVLVAPLTHAVTDAAADEVARRSVVFIDSHVPDLQGLVAGVRAGEPVFVLDADRDGVQQIADILAANQLHDLVAIHIVSHGSAGRVQLGSSFLDGAGLSGHSAQLAEIGSSLSTDGDLLLYGCNVATGAVGEQFVADLAAYTGADVAASDDLSGAPARGGDWNLEVETGSIEAGGPFSDQAIDGFGGTLPLVTETFTGTKGPFGTATFQLFNNALSSNGITDGTESISMTSGASFFVQDFQVRRFGNAGNDAKKLRLNGYNANNELIHTQLVDTTLNTTITVTVNATVKRLDFVPVQVIANGTHFEGQGSLRIDVDNLTYDAQPPGNTPPQITGISSNQVRSFRENGAVVLFNDPAVGILANIQDSDNDVLTVRVSADDPDRGLLISALSSPNGYFFTTVQPGVLEFVGTPSQATEAIRFVSLVLANVDDVVDTGQDYTTTFTVTLNDGHNPLVTNTQTQGIIHGINERPNITSSAASTSLVNQFTYDRDFIAPFTSLTIDDPDSKPVGNPDRLPDLLDVDVSFPDAKGALVGTGWAKTGVAGGVATWRFSGDYIQATAAIRAVLFDPTDTFIPGNVTNTAFTVKVTDQGDPFDHDPVRGAPLSFTFGSSISVDAKTNTSPVLAGGPINRGAILEGANSPAIAVSSLVSPPNAMTDVDTDQRRGVAIVAATGLWQYSTDGTNWTNFGTVSASAALVLSETTQIRMVGSDINGLASFTYKAWDRSSWLNNVGGTASSFATRVLVDASQFSAPPSNVSPFSLATVTNNQPITPINDAPNVVNGTTVSLTSIAEDTAPAGQTVTALFTSHFSDADDDQTAFGGSSANNLAGVAVIGNAETAAAGAWQYSTNAGITWTGIGTAVSDSNALLLSASTRIRFLPAADFNGQAPTLTVRLVEDSSGAITSGTSADVSVNGEGNGDPTRYSAGTIATGQTITPVNDPPVAGDDGLSSVNEDSGVRTIPFATLLGNDSVGPANESGQTLTITAVSNAVGGTVSISGQNVLFTPAANFHGLASFDYTVRDNGTTNGISDPLTDQGRVSFTVNPVADAPSVTTTTTPEDTQSTSGLVINHNAVDGAEVTHFRISGITNGTLFKSDGTTPINNGDFITAAEGLAGLKFTPAPNLNSPAGDTFSFVVQGATSAAGAGLGVGTTATITVTEVNDAPTATDDGLSSVVEDSGVRIIPFSALIGNDGTGPANESGQSLTITGVSNAVGGTVVISGTDVLFTPAANFHGTASFDYTVRDNGTTNGVGDFRTDTGTVTFTVTPIADTPSVTTATTAEDVQTTSGLVIGRNAADGGEVTHFQVTGITGGTLYLNDGTTPVADGSFITFAQGSAGLKFTPAPNLNSPAGDAFGFSVRAATDGSGSGLSAAAAVAVTVTEVNDAPGTTNDTLSAVGEDSGAVSIAFSALTGNDSAGPANEGGESLTVASVGNAIGGTVGIVGGSVIFAPAADFFGTASFEYFVEDNGTTNGTADPRTSAAPGLVSFTITPVADTPSVTDAATTANTQTTSGLVITPNAADGGTVTHYRVTGITNGTLFLNDGTTPVNDGDFVTAAQGLAGLKFTPATNLANPVTSFFFDVQAATGSTPADLGGGLARATIFVADNIPPETTIDTVPPAFSNSTAATFTFSGTDNIVPSVLTFEYSLDGSAFAAATSPLALSGLTDGSHTLQVRTIDEAGNHDPTPASYTWVVDTVGPTVSIGAPSAGITGTDAVSFTVTYSDANFDAATLTEADVTVLATGTAAATTVTVTPIDATHYTVTLSGISGDGTLAISVASGTAVDLAGNPAGAAGPSAAFTVDNTKPTISISGPSAGIARTGDSVTFTVTYADVNFDVATLTSADVTVVSTGSAAASTVTVTPIDATHFTVTLSDLSGDGTLAITVAGKTAADLAGNTADDAGPSAAFTADNTKPTVTIGPPSVSTTAGGPVSFTVTVADANPGSFSLTAAQVTLLGSTPTLTGTVTVTGTGNTRTITVSDIHGGAGTFQITLPAGLATDAAGNTSDAPLPSAAAAVTGSRNLLVSVVRPPARITAGSAFVYRINFANAGTQAADGVYLIARLPQHARFNAALSTPGWRNLGNGLFRLDLGAVAAGASGRVRFAVTFHPSTPPGTRAVFVARVADALSNGAVLASGRAVLTVGAPRWQ
jgi:hypothetical protein